MIPITRIDVVDAEPLVLEVLRSGNLAQGPMVARLESQFCETIGVEHCIAVNNGTTALIAALEVCDVKAGQEVITSPFTFVATLNAALKAGLSVRFADISQSDFNITPESVSALVNNNTAVLMPVHLYGQCADMYNLMPIAEKHELTVIEDAAQAHGAKIGKKFAGTFGIGCFSLYATKNITSAEGGLITTDDEQIADRLRVLRNQGMRERYQYEIAGNNYRMTDIHAAIAIPQLAKIHDITSSRQRNAAYLSQQLSDCAHIATPTQLPDRRHVWHQYTILLKENAPLSRDAFIKEMNSRGVSCGAYYPKLAFDYDCFRNHPNVIIDDVPTAKRITTSCVSLPVHQHLTRDQLDTIIENVLLILS